MMTQSDYHLRWIIRRDLPRVVEIDRHSSHFPWTEETLTSYLSNRRTLGMVAEYGDTITGFMLYQFSPEIFHLTYIAVDPAWRRLDVGRTLVRRLFGALSKRRPKLTTVVHESNLGAQLFFKFCGFKATSVLKNSKVGDSYRFEFNY